MSIAIAAGSGRQSLHSSSMRRRVIAGTTIGNALEFFDFTVFTFLMLIIGPLFFPAASSYGQLLLTTATFGVGFLMRPVGGMLIGSYADRHGRRAAMTLTLWLMGLGCALIAAAPTYAQMGVAGPVLMVLARLIQGFAAGGEVGASTTLLVEHAPADKRGFYSSWQFGSQSLGVMLGALTVALLTAALTKEQMQAWGWRVPFVIGILTVPVGAYIRRNLEETLEPPRAGQGVHAGSSGPASTHQPLRRVFAEHKALVVKGILLVIGGMVCAQIIGFYMPAYANKELGLPATSTLFASVVLGAIGFVLAPFVGMLADRVGRKRVIFWSRAATVCALLPCFEWLVSAPSTARLMTVIALLAVLLALQTAPVITMLPELFPKAVRTTGMSVVYGLGISVFGGFAQFFVTWLLHVTGNPMAPAWYLMVTVTLSTVVLFWIQDRTGNAIDTQEA
ncbi:major facilitator transporter [Achromobacter piechaudii]|uniref:Proline/betaine transporter n=1 Tax=Achromobacter piechaudii TaxID=72556 RepID=A0ABM8KTF6_9BURK|nr:MFS transporter [Achromobacter piechaudii]KNY11649.1 major facilitator transporter [Achromobacter piechaudii]CAB3672070.1 Proline/betaine transporter [Achromobacter piechaudii]CAB3836769.1 Proline/betaine transporter [Achromobacter piechaudii]CAB3943077.1 Proline/betaine transporter [Achromobacter piechaudii]